MSYPRMSDALCAVFVFLVALIVIVLFLVGSHTDHKKFCDPIPHDPKFRPFDHPHQPFHRLIPHFPDQCKTLDRGYAPDTTTISNELCSESNHPPYPYTKTIPNALFWVWGQFIDHMLVLTKPSKDKKIYVGYGLPKTSRSAYVLDSYGQRQQINHLAPFMDGSAVYGHSHERAYWLRAGYGGRMKTSVSHFTHEEMMPLNDSHYVGGDVRAEEHVLLACIHTLWMREHNYWAGELAHKNPEWDDEHLYNVARHMIFGEIQAITYNEWLPLLLGSKDLCGHEPCYTRSLSSSIRNEFATAFYRFGHSMVNKKLRFSDCQTCSSIKELNLVDAFFQHPAPRGNLWYEGIGGYLLGASKKKAKEMDSEMVDEMRRHLFGHNITLDLAALNIIRGREHCLPSFCDIYEYIHKRYPYDWEDITDDSILKRKLQHVYGNDFKEVCKKADPWIFALCEKPVNGALLGPTSVKLIAEQFAHIRDTDSYFYLWDSVTMYYRTRIHNTKLSSVILRNTNIHKKCLSTKTFLYY